MSKPKAKGDMRDRERFVWQPENLVILKATAKRSTIRESGPQPKIENANPSKEG